jgi:hypothetical protein
MSGLLTSEMISRRMLPSLLAIGCGLSLVVSPAPAEEAAGTAGAADGYPLTRLILDTIDRIPFGNPQSFPSVEAVENYFGMGTPQATLASDFFANGAGRNDKARLKFVRFVPGGGRPRLFGPDLSSIALATVQALDGATLSFTQNGFTYDVTLPSSGAKAPSNIADPCAFPPTGSATANCLYDLANDIEAAVNSSAPQAGTMAGSSIAAASSSFVGTISGGIMDVQSVTNGTVAVGGVVTTSGGYPPGYRGNVQAQYAGPGGCSPVGVSGCAAGGVGQYGVFYSTDPRSENGVPVATPTAIAERYGVLTVGTMTSGLIQLGVRLSGTGVSRGSYLLSNISGAGGGSCSGSACNGTTWVVNPSQKVSSRSMAVYAPDMIVTYANIEGATANTNALWLEKSGYAGNALGAPSTLTYASGGAACTLGWTEACGAILSTPGELVSNPGAWMTQLVTSLDSEWGSFQTGYVNTAPDTTNALAAWAAATGGEYRFLSRYETTTRPICPGTRGC